MKPFVLASLAGGFLLSAPALAFDLTPADSLGAVTTGNTLSLSTGTGDRAISSLGTWLTGDTNSLVGYGTEGSGARWTGINNGVYEIEWELLTKDQANFDNLTVWNQRETAILGDNRTATGCVTLSSGRCSTAQFTTGRQRSTVEVGVKLANVLPAAT